uniref:Ig-like domain-containing protein n=1 Tax=Pygocentrus nattereri TaxID=42514 RepID=A0AAR2JDR7_PYGNA
MSTRPTFSLSIVSGLLCSAGEEVVRLQELEGNTVTIHTGLTGVQSDAHILWLYGPENADIKIVNSDSFEGKIITNYDSERFRDRLQLNRTSGSLTIRNISREDSGVYKLQINTKISDFERGVVLEGNTVTIHTGLTGVQSDAHILWFQGPESTMIVNSLIIRGEIITDYDSERFRDRLQLNRTSGSLTITNISREDSGVIDQISGLVISSFTQGLLGRDEVETVEVKEGATVTLRTDWPSERDADIVWMFGTTNTGIALKDSSGSSTHYDERFRDRLQLDTKTGSLTISNISTTHSGDYKVQIFLYMVIFNKQFNVTVYGKGVLVLAYLLADKCLLIYTSYILCIHFNVLCNVHYLSSSTCLCTDHQTHIRQQ